MDEDEKMTELAKKIKNERAREWARKNKDKVRERNKRYWEKKAIQTMQKEQDYKK